jgi:hypothetical protein
MEKCFKFARQKDLGLCEKKKIIILQLVQSAERKVWASNIFREVIQQIKFGNSS